MDLTDILDSYTSRERAFGDRLHAPDEVSCQTDCRGGLIPNPSPTPDQGNLSSLSLGDIGEMLERSRRAIINE